jgi:Molybdenum cofactor biosynthesis enzyme
VSLDTLKKDNFFKITRRDKFEDVFKGIEKLMQLGIKVKINCLAIKEHNLDEIVKIAAYSKDNNIDVRFIELMPIGNGKKYTGISNETILQLLEREYGKFVKTDEKRGNGPAVYYKNDKFKGYIGLISAISHEFCETCNRIRLTSDGFLKLCLHYNKGVDLKQPIRNNITDEELKNIICEAVKNKPLSHNFYNENDMKNIEYKNMVQIGG